MRLFFVIAFFSFTWNFTWRFQKRHFPRTDYSQVFLQYSCVELFRNSNTRYSKVVLNYSAGHSSIRNSNIRTSLVSTNICTLKKFYEIRVEDLISPRKPAVLKNALVHLHGPSLLSRPALPFDVCIYTAWITSNMRRTFEKEGRVTECSVIMHLLIGHVTIPRITII